MESNNKFYMLQLIKSEDTFKVFRKWGRVGAVNPQVQHLLLRCDPPLER